MSAEDSLKLFIGLISAVGALIGTWAGSYFTKVNEHSKWLRDQKLEVYRESYQATQRWINSISAIATTMSELMSELQSLNGVSAADMTKEQQAAHLQKFDELIERRKAVEVQAQEMKQHITDYGMLPVTLVADRYIQSGVRGVAEALRGFSPVMSDQEREAALKAYASAQEEMVARFRDDLKIRHQIPLRAVMNYWLRVRRHARQAKRTAAAQEA